jgi:hypothetical protein
MGRTFVEARLRKVSGGIKEQGVYSMRRLFRTAAVGAGVAVSASALVVGMAGVAGAVKPTSGSSVACTKLVYSSSKNSATIEKCYNSAGKSTGSSYKELIAKPATTLLSGGVVKWSPVKGATITTSALTSATPKGTCAKGDTKVAYTGTLTAVTGTGDPAKVNDVVYVSVCVSSKGAVSLAKGTAAEF